MSFRQAIRSRFKSLERDSKERETDSPPVKRKDSNDITDDKHLLPIQNGHRDGSSPLGSPNSPKVPYQGLVEETDNEEESETNKSVYEQQLTQLQEQLVAAMIENQSLAEELDNFKNKNQVKKLELELETERHKVDTLTKKLAEGDPPRPQSSLGADWVEVAHEVKEDDTPGGPLTWRERLNKAFFTFFYELIQDFTEEPQPENTEEMEDEQLAVKKLKENIKRFKSGTKPIYTTIKGIYSVLQWKYPAFTLLAFIVYMYSVWHGWLLPVFLFLLIFRLFINYLRHKGWNINIVYFSDYEDEDSNKDTDNFKDLGMSDKFNLVLQVARKVQNGLGTIADNLEKFKNLLTWKQPEATAQLFFTLCAAFVASCLLSGETLFFVGGLYMGIKWFIIEYIYHRFPRIRAKYDSVHKIVQTLPTDADLEKRYHQAAVNRNIMIAASGSEVNDELATDRSNRQTEDDIQFCQLFNLPFSEMPRPGWEGGRRCTLINKDKPLSSAFKHGKLYLTNNFICFERYKSQSPKNLMIALTDVTGIQKAKPYAWMPGGGMSIEMFVAGYDRPYIFGAILSRDEVFDSLILHAKKKELPWVKKETTAAGDKEECKSRSEFYDEKESQSSPSSPRPAQHPKLTMKLSDLKDNADEDSAGKECKKKA